MQFELTETTCEKHKGLKLETCKTIAVRDGDEVQERFHDMRIGEIRELRDGLHITRLS